MFKKEEEMKRFYFFYKNGKLMFSENPVDHHNFVRFFKSYSDAKKFADKRTTKNFKIYRKQKGDLQ